MHTTTQRGLAVAIDRRAALRLCGGFVLALAPSVAGAEPQVFPTDQEPHHHVIFQNGVIRVMRVLIPPGDTTGWHEHHLDFVNTILHGTTIRTERQGEGPPVDGAMRAGAVLYSDFQAKPSVDRVTNTVQTLNDQLAFEILRGAAGGFGRADRSDVAPFSLVLDTPRVRGWRLTLDPGATTPRYTQNGPGLRVILSGGRLIETTPGEIGKDIPLLPDAAMFTLPATRMITNAAETPLDVIDFELR